MPENSHPIDVVLLAGDRPSGDPLANALGAQYKALVPVAGKAMLRHVLDRLLASPLVATIHILGQNPAALLGHDDLADLAGHPRIMAHMSKGNISESVSALLDEAQLGEALVTTADNVLLTEAMIRHFLTIRQKVPNVDLAIALVERETLLAAYPEAKRTWLKTRGGAWSGANLILLRRSDGMDRLLHFWRDIEQNRKRGWKLMSAFGPLLLIGAFCRIITMQRGLKIAGGRFGLIARLVDMPQAEACIDVDKPSDLALAERIIAARQSA
ncbi:MAG: NTP transferase domain-containing protein [Blastomonas sp.]